MHVEGLQRLAARGWPGLEVAALGEWELHAGAGFTGRANACLPSGDPGLPPAQAVRAVEAWYADRGIAPRFQVAYELQGTEDPAPGIDALLAADGWVADPTTVTMASDIAALPAPIDRGEVRVAWAPTPDPEWLGLYHYRGAPLPEVALRVITAAPAHYLSLLADGRLIGIGRAVVTDNWVGLSAIEVAADARRRGLGSLITSSLVARGAEHGATRTYLQVFENNAAAVRLYRGLGFRPHHRYHYRTRP